MDEAQLYTLRVWRHAGQWRAAVRAVGYENQRLFTEPAPLIEWLLQQAEAAPVASSQTQHGVVPHQRTRG